MAKQIGLTGLLLLGAQLLLAQAEKIDTDRPDQTESAVTVPKHYFQGEFGFNKENFHDKDYDLVHPTALLKYGFGRIEARLELIYKNSYIHRIPNPEWHTGFDPVEIGFKAALWEEKKFIPKTSLIVHLSIPALGSKPFRPDHIFPSFRFTFQNSITDKMGLGYNVGAEWDGYISTPTWIYTLAPGFNLGEKWYAYAEIFGFIRKGEKPDHRFDAGVAYYVSKDVKIDFSAGTTIQPVAPETYIAFGFSFRCDTKKKPMLRKGPVNPGK